MLTFCEIGQAMSGRKITKSELPLTLHTAQNLVLTFLPPQKLGCGLRWRVHMTGNSSEAERRMTALIEVARVTGKSLDDLYDRSSSMAASDFAKFCGKELSTPR